MRNLLRNLHLADVRIDPGAALSFVPYPMSYYAPLDEPKTREVVINNDASALPSSLVLFCTEDSSGSLNITRVEMYADAERQILIHDDIEFAKLPRSTQLLLDTALEAHLHVRLEERKRAFDNSSRPLEQWEILGHFMDRLVGPRR